MFVHMNKLILGFISLFILGYASAAEVHKRQTESGAVEYSDIPTSDSEPLQLPPVNEIKSQGYQQGSSGQDQIRAEPEDRYRNVWIISPVNNEVLRDNQGILRITLGFDPGFHAQFGHQIEVLVDGTFVARFSDPQKIQLQDLERGSHSIMVRIVDQSGAPLFTSQAITIHMKRTSILHPKPVH